MEKGLAVGADRASILVVTDDAELARVLLPDLRRQAIDAHLVTRGRDAITAVVMLRPDALIVDLVLPDMSGIDVCREVRDRSLVPMIAIASAATEIDAVLALELGADDFVARPTSRELVARARAHIRRARLAPTLESRNLQVGDVALDVEEHRAFVGGVCTALPLKEYRLLELFLANPGQVLTREVLIARVWGANYFGDTKTLDVHIRRLRAKIEQDPRSPRWITTVRGVGYRYERAPALVAVS
jgi:two-component system response regulator RegX3